MDHMIFSVMHCFQEGTEKKNHTFLYLNSKDQANVQMAYEMCFLIAAF